MKIELNAAARLLEVTAGVDQDIKEQQDKVKKLKTLMKTAPSAARDRQLKSMQGRLDQLRKDKKDKVKK
jgi:hypothetical protein